jgi:hypothetical protein
MQIELQLTKIGAVGRIFLKAHGLHSVANSSASPTVAYASGSECSVSASVFFRVIPWLILLSFSVLIKKTNLEGWARLA